MQGVLTPSIELLKFQESQWTIKFSFRECEFHPHTLSKWGCDKSYNILKYILY
jgi:hypothetical protein